MATAGELEQGLTLRTAVARYDALRARDSLASAGDTGVEPLSRSETLELLALGEVIARMAGYGRQLSVRSARKAGASWSEIGAAMGTTKQAAWEAHNRWIDDQAAEPPREGHWGWDHDDLAHARRLAGRPESITAD